MPKSGCLTNTSSNSTITRLFNDYGGTERRNPRKKHETPPQNCLQRGSFMIKNGKSLDFKRFSGVEKVHRNSIKITVDLWRRVRDSNPRYITYTAFRVLHLRPLGQLSVLNCIGKRSQIGPLFSAPLFYQIKGGLSIDFF